MGVAGVDVAGEAQPHDVNVGDGLIEAVGAAPLHLELTQGEVTVEPQVRLDELDGDVHGVIFPHSTA